ncbi:MAG: tetratricopeptide repeat protein [Planctomycetota bacterium]
MLTTLLLTTLPFQAQAATLDKARAAFEKGAYKEVVELAKGAASEADAPRLAYLAGEAQLVLGVPSEAEASFRAVLAKRPQALPAQVGLGRALHELQRLDEAAKVLEAALKSDPKDIGALTAHGLLASTLGRAEVAKKELAQAYQLDPGNPFTVRGYVEVLLRAEDTPTAASVIESFEKTHPRHPLGPFLMAWTMERDGEDEQAVEQYQLALERDPTYLDAHKNLAILCHTLSNTYQLKERVELAYAHYQQYFDLGGRDAELKTMFDSLVAFKEQILEAGK